MTNPGTRRGESVNRRLSRRTFLRGAGVTMALPWLESLAGRDQFSLGGHHRRAAPALCRAVHGHGNQPGRWWAKGAGAGMELSESLAPLDPIKAKINVIHGLFNKQATGHGIHPAMTGNLLSGVPIHKGAIIHGGITIDQVLANRIGQETLQPGVASACERAVTGYMKRTSRMPTARTFRGRAPNRRCPTKSIPRSPSTACSRIAETWATPACSTG